MRKAQKQGLLGIIGSLHQVHEEIKKALEQGSPVLAQDRLGWAQESAISLGEQIEGSEGEGHDTVACIEEYCELLFQVFEEIRKNNYNANKIYKTLRKQLIKIENSVKNDITVKMEIVFFPYKASMWDSLESIYLAAEADPDCDAYCVPIPYYTLNPDHSFGEMHYEGSEYPENIRVTDWQAYNFEERKPDVIYIHNPYDNCNLVTSVPPRFYSPNLKKYTDTLVYVPYYSTSGGMSKAQSLCPAYIYADYIVIQSPEFRRYFDAGIPDRKFLPFGSPKFDRIIKKCQNPPEPPKEWAEKMKGRKVYFYNTSISGMLADTEKFLKKMKCVFQCFQGREDACLLWRPHPLLEASFHSMRPEFCQIYNDLKEMFVEGSLGIYDTTSDISNTVALCDVYIGDVGTSVISLFEAAGKPIFILRNYVDSNSEQNDWRSEIHIDFENSEESGCFAITQGNSLYKSELGQYHYKYICDLSESAYGNYYAYVHTINDIQYISPFNAQDILVLNENGVEKKIELAKLIEKGRAFLGGLKHGRYLILIPLQYPAIVRYDTVSNKIQYLSENIGAAVKPDQGVGGICVYKDILYIASLVDNQIYQLHIESGESRVIDLPIKSRCGCISLIEYHDEMWLLPFKGKVIVRWNPLTGEANEYAEYKFDLKCRNPIYGYKCEDRPFSSAVCYGEYMYLAPYWMDICLKFNMATGEFTRWELYLEEGDTETLFVSSEMMFFQHGPEETGPCFKMYSYSRQKLYEMNVETNKCWEIDVQFDVDAIWKHEARFGRYSEKLQYVCVETPFVTLKSFLDKKIVDRQFSKEKQMEKFRAISVNDDGTCGQKIHEFITMQG